jgi:RNA polymerase sigma-70 factor (ECF subfamily)
MPPYVGWYQGAESIGQLIGQKCPAEGPGDQILVPTSANGQPAFGLYMRQPDGSHSAFQLQVLTLSGHKVSHVACFFDTTLFGRFGLPEAIGR